MLEPIISLPSLASISNTLNNRNNLAADLGKIALASQVTRSDDDVWVSIVNVVILCFTILGSGMILVSMFYLEVFRARPGTTRTRIVQALIVSDFLLGIIGLVSSCLLLQGNGERMAHGSVSCDGLGLLLTTILWTEHGWTLILAVATFMILIYPLHWFTLWMEQRWYYLWAVVWVISIAVGVMGYELYGFYPSAGTCFYGANAGLYSELMQFIPRCVVCIVITVLYARLYIFLKRPDKIRLPGSNSASGPYETVSMPTQRRKSSIPFRGRLGSLIPFKKKRGSSGEVLSPSPAEQEQQDSELSTSASASNEPMQTEAKLPSGAILSTNNEKENLSSRKPSEIGRSLTPAKDIPPWEKVELPAFQVDGERFGGPSANNNTQQSSIWSGWRGMGSSSGRKRSSTTTANSGNTSAVTTNIHSPSRLNSISNSIHNQKNQNSIEDSSNPTSTNLRVSPPGLYVPRMPSIPSEDHVIAPTSAVIRHQRNSTDDTMISSGFLEDKKRKKSVQLPPPLSLSPKSNASSSPEIGFSPKIDNRSRPSVTISDDIPVTIIESTPTMDENIPFPSQEYGRRKDTPTMILPPRSANPWAGKSPSQPNTPGAGSGIAQQNFQLNFTSTTSNQGKSSDQSQLANDEEFNDNNEEEEDEDEWDLARMLAQPPPNSHLPDDRFLPNQSRNSRGETYELVPESMSSYLNRKTALLMLWFPLGYLFLFSVSLIRIIYDFAGQPPTSLRAISKWMILAQGILDAIIYGIVEWHTKRVVRKKVKKGTFSSSQPGTSNSNQITSGIRNKSKNFTNGFLKNLGNSTTTSKNGIKSNQQKEEGEIGINSINSINSNKINNNNNNNNNKQGGGGNGNSSSSSFFIPEKNQSQINSLTEWNQNFSIGSIQEDIPFQIINSNNNNNKGSFFINSYSNGNEKNRKGSESPLGGVVVDNNNNNNKEINSNTPKI
ncbi:uncharacterized protein I206_101975 [Kwoniella pini CBS 10737]|uniref:Glucose receptor Git3-like N-terminal domain-containing protein n=1 Tax=Kwoniella pini CBS 10737 TaxID=1296096 RepID=A0A1B9HV69_9TREE|nr:uncharacterized protein I206_06934 [Kwoniella pini CBS 10737]OCF47156.1 hypothetical protein I206_06934 [Kwoniella pini CBS 10737]